MEPVLPKATAGSFVAHPATWTRFKALAAQNPEIKLPQSYMRMELSQLNAKQLVKVNKLFTGVFLWVRVSHGLCVLA